MNATEKLVKGLLKLNAHRWAWHVNLPNVESVTTNEMICLLQPEVEWLKAKGYLEEAQLEAWKKESVEMGEDLVYKAFNIVKSNCVALKLIKDKSCRDKLFRSADFFRNNFVFASNVELHATLQEIKDALSLLTSSQSSHKKIVYAEPKYIAVVIHELGLDKEALDQTA